MLKNSVVVAETFLAELSPKVNHLELLRPVRTLQRLGDRKRGDERCESNRVPNKIALARSTLLVLAPRPLRCRCWSATQTACRFRVQHHAIGRAFRYHAHIIFHRD